MLEAGTVIRAAEVGVLASLGLDKVKVVRRPVVSVLATGDELESAGSALSAGRYTTATASAWRHRWSPAGACPACWVSPRDNLDDLHAKLAATEGSDLVITSQGFPRATMTS